MGHRGAPFGAGLGPPYTADGGHDTDDKAFREQLVALLTKGQAHVTLGGALRDLAPEWRGRRPAPGIHSIWEELTHVRIAQEDILRYTLDPAWKSPPFPEGYWPAPESIPTDAQWDAALSGFRRDLEDTCALARDPARDLTTLIPHGEGRTYLRQVLLIADHNAYHLGQIVQTRKLLGAWKGK
jgi:uncharacterized damage-inducible protein DinB